MAFYNLEEAFFAATIYVMGHDGTVSLEEMRKYGPTFKKKVTESFWGNKTVTGLDDEVKKGIIERWKTKNRSGQFLEEIAESLKGATEEYKMEIAESIWRFIKDLYKEDNENFNERFKPFVKLMGNIGISKKTLDNHFVDNLNDKYYKFLAS